MHLVKDYQTLKVQRSVKEPFLQVLIIKTDREQKTLQCRSYETSEQGQIKYEFEQH